MQSNQKLLIALVIGAAATSASALAQKAPAACAFSTIGCSPAPAEAPPPAPAATPAKLPPGVIVVDGYKYHLPEEALKNLDAVRALITVGDALGMIRNNTYGGATHYTVGEATDGWEYHATGTVGGQKASLIVGLDYRLPAIRYEAKRGEATELWAAAGKLSWEESKPGVYSGAAKASAEERLMQIYLLPPAVVTMGRQAADKIKLGTRDGLRELTIPIAAYASDLRAVLDAKGHPVHTEMAVGGKLYSADYGDYGETDTMEFHVYFPHKIVQKVDGAVTADLVVSEHWINPYLVWPIPQPLRGAAPKAP